MADLYPNIEPYDYGMLETATGTNPIGKTCGNPSDKPALGAPQRTGF
jgi:proline iminopeptidase